MKWLERPAGPAPRDPDALLKHLLQQASENVRSEIPIKEVEVEALAAALRKVFQERGETDPSPFQVVELSARTLRELGAVQAARLLLIFGSGIVQPSIWEISGGDRIWMLDLQRLTFNADMQLELTFFRLLDTALLSMSEVWNASSGRGRLGLRHVRGTAEHLLSGRAEPTRIGRLFAREVLLRSQARLEHLASHRHWKHVPEVISLD